MTSDASDIASRTDALVCQAAVMLLRAGQKARLAGEDLAQPLDRLLSAVSDELETDRDSIPTAVRCATVQLAEHLVRRSSIPVPRGAGGRHKRGERPPSNPRGSAAPTRRSTVPFTRSIRLGRMG